MPVRQDPRTRKWYYRFYRGRSYFKGGFRTREAAKHAEAEQLNQSLQHGGYFAANAFRLTVAEGGKLFFERHSQKHKRSWKNDRARIWALVKYFQNKRMSQVTPEDLEAFLEHEQSTHHLSHNTRNHYLSLVKSIYNRLRKWRMYRGDNPAEYIEMKKVPRARVRFLYPAEEQQLTPVVLQDSIVWPHYVAALHTGMRIGELVRMKVEDIALATRSIFVPMSKSSRSRYVPLSEELAAFLVKCTAGKSPSDYALAGVTASYVSRRFAGLCAQAGVVNLKFHDLRHTFASRLLSRGVPIYKVSKILGHSSVVVTEQHYGHLSLADMRGAISRIEGVVTFAADLHREAKTDVWEQPPEIAKHVELSP